jgi:hypothetical protein
LHLLNEWTAQKGVSMEGKDHADVFPFLCNYVCVGEGEHLCVSKLADRIMPFCFECGLHVLVGFTHQRMYAAGQRTTRLRPIFTAPLFFCLLTSLLLILFFFIWALFFFSLCSNAYLVLSGNTHL